MKFNSVSRSKSAALQSENEDSVFADDEMGLYVVADGVSGLPGGREAADIAVGSLAAFFKTRRTMFDAAFGDHGTLKGMMSRAFDTACDSVYEARRGNEAHAGMSCTLTALWCKGDQAVVGHVGDSRVYLLRGSKALRLSNDHTVSAELMREGILSAEQEAVHHFRHVLSRALGHGQVVRSETLVIACRPGDRFLLCTDGVSDALESERLSECIAGQSLDQAAARLEESAAGKANRGDASFVIMEQNESDTEPGEETLWPKKESALVGLSQTALFADLPLRRLVGFANIAEVRHFSTNEKIVQQGTLLDSLYIVTAGTAIVTHANGAQRTLRAGDTIGDSYLMASGPARFELRAASTCKTLQLSRARLLKAAHQRPWAGLKLFERLSEALSKTLQNERELAGSAQ